MKQNTIVLLFLIFIATLVLTFKINKPFIGHHDFNNAFYGNMARNLVRLPLIETKLGQPTNSGINPALPLSFHTHHPPLLIWSLALSYFVFGISEWATRLVPVLFSLGTIYYFFKLLKLKFSLRAATFASIFWIISPLFIYFGKMAIHEVLVVFFFIFSYYYFSIWIEKKEKKHLYITIFGLIGGCLSGWAGYYSVFVIVFNYWLIERKINKLIIGLTLIPILLFSLHLFHNYILTGSIGGGGFSEVFLLRSSQVPWIGYVKKEISWIVAYFTKPIFLLALVGFPPVWYRLKDKRIFLISLLLFGFLHLILFRQAAFRHDYLIYYLLPLMVTIPALMLDIIPNVKLRNITFLLIVLMSVYSSYRFTTALENSNYNREGVTAGKLIAQKTSATDWIVLVSQKIYNNSDWQVIFYADRFLTIVPKLENAPLGSDWLISDLENDEFSFKHNL